MKATSSLRLTSALIATLAVFFFAATANAEEPAGVALGGAIPQAVAAQAMVGTDGKDYTLEGVRGEKGTLVVFSCVHCPYVKAWDVRMAALGNEYAKKGVGVLFVNSNDPATFPVDGLEGMKEQAASQGYTFPYVIDATSDVARAFDARKTPDVFLFDAKGALVYHGAVDDNAQDAPAVSKTYLSDALEAVVKGTAVPVAETKAMGCSIKFREP